jgi:protease-4
MRQSLFFSALRSFFTALFAVIGIGIGFLLLMILIAALPSTTSTTDLTNKFSPEVMANANGERKSVSATVPVILKLNLHGVIGGEELTTDMIKQLLVESREGSLKNDRVKAILLSINSPGGTVVDSDGIYRAIKHYKEQYKVPVYAHVDGLCASGGYYSACAADKIFATEASLIGSIGVIVSPFFNFTQLIDKLGIQALTLSAGKGKDELNPLRPWKAGEQENLQSIINYYYALFVDIVAANRPELDKSKLINDYGANVFNPTEAQQYGYINEKNSTESDVLKLLLQQIGIENEEYQVVELQHKTWFSELFKGEWSLLRGQVTHQLQLLPELPPQLMGQFLYLHSPALH